MYTFLRFGFWNFNSYEERQYRLLIRQIPEELQGSFAEVFGCRGNELLQELICDDSGDVSKNLRDSDDLPAEFWHHLRKLTDFLKSQDIFLFDIRPYNILVKRTNGNVIPVLFDYKRIGARMYPLQPWLRMRRFARRRMQRRVEQLFLRGNKQ